MEQKEMSTSEKVILELYRKKMTQKQLAEKLDITTISVCYKIKNNTWKIGEIAFMKYELNFDL